MKIRLITDILAIIVFGVWLASYAYDAMRADSIKAGYMVVKCKLYKITEVKNEQANN